MAAFSYDTKVLLERHVAGRDLAVSVLDGPEGGGPLEALPVVEAIPRDGDRYDFDARYEIGRTEFVCPADARPGDHRPRAGHRAWTPSASSAATASRAST